MNIDTGVPSLEECLGGLSTCSFIFWLCLVSEATVCVCRLGNSNQRRSSPYIPVLKWGAGIWLISFILLRIRVWGKVQGLEYLSPLPTNDVRGHMTNATIHRSSKAPARKHSVDPLLRWAKKGCTDWTSSGRYAKVANSAKEELLYWWWVCSTVFCCDRGRKYSMGL